MYQYDVVNGVNIGGVVIDGATYPCEGEPPTPDVAVGGFQGDGQR